MSQSDSGNAEPGLGGSEPTGVNSGGTGINSDPPEASNSGGVTAGSGGSNGSGGESVGTGATGGMPSEGTGGNTGSCSESGCECATGNDCASLVCNAGTCEDASCDDAVKNQGETAVDCGGPCAACPSDCTNVIADSVSDFSDTQGHLGWSYGYFHEPQLNGLVFTPLALYEKESWSTGENYWTDIRESIMHPNGAVSGGGRLPEEQWSVRRWISSVSATVLVEGNVQRSILGGNGTITRIYVAGSQVWEQALPYGTVDVIPFQTSFHVKAGEPIDFIVDGDGDDFFDDTLFTVQVCN